MNIIEFINVSSLGLIVIFTPIILGLVEVFKRFVSNTRYSPIFAIIVGVILAYFFSGIEEVPFRFLLGVISGLSASGLYSGAKTVAGN